MAWATQAHDCCPTAQRDSSSKCCSKCKKELGNAEDTDLTAAGTCEPAVKRRGTGVRLVSCRYRSTPHAAFQDGGPCKFRLVNGEHGVQGKRGCEERGRGLYGLQQAGLRFGVIYRLANSCAKRHHGAHSRIA